MRVGVELEDRVAAPLGRQFQGVRGLRAEPDLRLGPEEAGLADDGQDAGPARAGRLAVVGLEELLRVQLSGDEDEPPGLLPDESRDHLRPLRAEGPHVRVDQQEGVVAVQLLLAVRQPGDRPVARLPEARVGVLEPGGELDVLVAHQGVVEELHLGARPAGDQEDADLLPDDLHRGVRDVVLQRQLRAGVLDAGAELVLADDLGDDPERRPLEDAVLAERDPLVADRLPVALVDASLQDDRRLGVAEPAASTTTASVIGSRAKTTGLASISARRTFRGPSSAPAAIA